MSDTSTVKPPYIQGAVPEVENEDDVYSLEPNHGYKVGRDHRNDPTVFSIDLKSVLPSVTEASQLDHDVNAVPYGWHSHSVLTLVTQDGKVDLPQSSHFITDAKNNVIWPDPETPSCDLEVSPSFLLTLDSGENVPESRE